MLAGYIILLHSIEISNNGHYLSKYHHMKFIGIHAFDFFHQPFAGHMTNSILLFSSLFTDLGRPESSFPQILRWALSGLLTIDHQLHFVRYL